MIQPVLINQTETLEEVLSVIQAAFAEQEGLIEPPSSMNTLSVLDIYDHLETNQVWVIRDKAQITACLFGTDKGQSYYLSKLSVHPDARGQGHGTSLMREAEAFARTNRFQFVEVIARVELIQNHAMFEAFGYRKFAEGRHPGFDRTTEIHFRKAL